jgi:acyl carrier protein
MERSELESKIVDIITNQLGVEKDAVTAEAHVIDDLGADSLDVVELVMALEESFDVEIPDDDAEKIRTVKDIFDYLDQALKGKSHPGTEERRHSMEARGWSALFPCIIGSRPASIRPLRGLSVNGRPTCRGRFPSLPETVFAPKLSLPSWNCQTARLVPHRARR